MSTWPGGALEDYLMFWYDLIVDDDNTANESLRIAEILGVNTRRIRITKEQFKPIIDLFEPYRESMETCLNWYNEDTMSWRDYCGFPLDHAPDGLEKQGQVIVRGYREALNSEQSGG